MKENVEMETDLISIFGLEAFQKENGGSRDFDI